MKISRSPDLEWKSPDFFTKDYAGTVDRQFAIAAGESIVSLANFV